MATKLNFEGLVGVHEFAGLSAYKGFDVTTVGVVGRGVVFDTFPTSGYANVIVKKGVGYVVSGGSFEAQAGTFSLKDGIFADAWNTGETVTFTAFLGGVEVGHKTVLLDQDAVFLKFGAKFKHIDAFTVTAEGGTDADSGDAGSGHLVALDDVRVAFDVARPPPSHHFALDDLASQALDAFHAHWADVPFA